MIIFERILSLPKIYLWKTSKCSMNIIKMKIESENEIKFRNGTRGRTYSINFIKLYSLDKFQISDRWEQWTMVFWSTILIRTRFYFVYFLFNSALCIVYIGYHCRNGEWNFFKFDFVDLVLYYFGAGLWTEWTSFIAIPLKYQSFDDSDRQATKALRYIIPIFIIYFRLHPKNVSSNG